MTEQEARNQLMDYLYNEMDDRQRADFEEYLETNQALQKELNELKGTRNLLDNAPVDTPSHKLIYLPQDFEPDNQSQEKFFPVYKTILAAAASLLIAVMIFVFTGVQFGHTENGFYLALGNQPPAEEAVSEEDVIDLMEQIKNENALLMAAMLEQAREQQNEQLEHVLAELANYYDLRREQDLYLIAEGIAQLQEETYYRFFRTNEALGEVIYALNNP